MTVHPALVAALESRGRKPESWGADNELAIKRMRQQLRRLHSHPAKLASLWHQSTGGRVPVGMNEGGYVRRTDAINSTHPRLGE